MKKCSYCAEEIQDEAIKCKHCGEWIKTNKPFYFFDFDLPEEGINFEELEKTLMKKAMLKAKGVVANAAKLLGMTYKTFWYRWKKLDLKDKRKDS